MKKLIAGNWKMNLTREGVNQLVYDLMQLLPGAPDGGREFLVCPPYVYLDRCAKFFMGSAMAVGAQDCSVHANGAFTGDISADMVRDFGCSHVILGHSERRQFHKETDAVVVAKAAQAHRAGLTAIICVGETEKQREAGQEKAVVQDQILHSLPQGTTAQNVVVAYEPVWAIGTGKTATVDDIKEMHAFIRGCLSETLADYQNIRILYGGSVKPSNAGEIFAVEHVGGALIGGASLKAQDYWGIAQKA